MNEGIIVESELERLIQQNQNDYNVLLHESIMESTAELDLKEQELALIRKSFEEYRTKRELEDDKLHFLKKRIDEHSKSLKSKEKQLNSFQRELDFCCREVDKKEREYNAIQRSVEEQSLELEAKEDQLKSVEREIYECERVLQLKKEECDRQREMKHHLISEHNEVVEKMKREIEEYENDFEAKKARLCSIDDLIRGHEKELCNVHKDVESKKEELKAKEGDLGAMQRLIDGKGKELEFKRKNLLTSMKVKIDQHAQHARELELKKKEFEEKERQFEGRVKQFEDQVRELKSKHVHFEGRVKEFESEKNEFNVRVEKHESKEEHLRGQVKELESKEKYLEDREKELESNKNRYKEMVGEIESTEKLLGEHMKEYESRQKHFEVQLKEFDFKEKQFEARMKDLEFKKDQYEEKVKELELKEAQFKVQVKELELKEVQFKLKLKEFETQKKQFKALEEEKVLKEKSSIILHQVKTNPLYFTNGNSVDNSKKLELLFNLVKKYELICSQVSEAIQTSTDPTKLVLDAIKGFCPPQLVEGEVNILTRIFNLLMDEFKKSSPVIRFRVKEEAVKFATNWKVKLEAAADINFLEVLDFFRFIATYEIGSCFNENELHRLLYIIAQRCQAPQVHDYIEKLPDNQLSLPTTDGGNLQLISNESVLIDKDTLVNLQTSPDPAQLVLDMIHKPNESINIEESHIVLLEQLMEISPHIKPQVREEAMKLALYLKENMRGSTKNSLVVLGFLLLLSNYGLVSYFNEDEILKLLEFAAQHKLAVNLFRTLGFVDKIYDFVQNLVTKKQHIEAVRFICAYKLSDKIQPVNLLQQYMERVKQMSQRYNSTKSTETKVRAIDKEMGSLGTILRCIADNKLESQDLVNEIKDRILFLEKEKEDIVREASKSSSKVEIQQPEEQRPADEVVTKNKMQQLEESKCVNEAVSENQVKVQQLDKKRPYNGADTMNQKNVLKKCITEAVTRNPVQHSQEKKRVIDAILSNHQFNQSGNNKRPRTTLTDSVPPFFPSYSEYQRAFVPREMPPHFWFPTNYFGLPNPLGAEQVEDRGTNYFYHSGPHLPYRRHM